MDRDNDTTPVVKLVMAFLAVIGALQFFDAGSASQYRHWSEMAANLIIGTFALLALWAILLTERRRTEDKALAKIRDAEFKSERAIAAAEKAAKDLAEEVHKAVSEMGEPSKKEQLEAAIYDAIDTVIGDTPGEAGPTPAQIEQICQLFHDRTDFYLKLEFKPGGVMTEVSGTPFNTTTETATTTTTTTGEATDIVKSKSQQRREAVQKTAIKKKG